MLVGDRPTNVDCQQTNKTFSTTEEGSRQLRKSSEIYPVTLGTGQKLEVTIRVFFYKEPKVQTSQHNVCSVHKWIEITVINTINMFPMLRLFTFIFLLSSWIHGGAFSPDLSLSRGTLEIQNADDLRKDSIRHIYSMPLDQDEAKQLVGSPNKARASNLRTDSTERFGVLQNGDEREGSDTQLYLSTQDHYQTLDASDPPNAKMPNELDSLPQSQIYKENNLNPQQSVPDGEKFYFNTRQNLQRESSDTADGTERNEGNAGSLREENIMDQQLPVLPRSILPHQNILSFNQLPKTTAQFDTESEGTVSSGILSSNKKDHLLNPQLNKEFEGITSSRFQPSDGLQLPDQDFSDLSVPSASSLPLDTLQKVIVNTQDPESPQLRNSIDQFVTQRGEVLEHMPFADETSTVATSDLQKAISSVLQERIGYNTQNDTSSVATSGLQKSISSVLQERIGDNTENDDLLIRGDIVNNKDEDVPQDEDDNVDNALGNFNFFSWLVGDEKDSSAKSSVSDDSKKVDDQKDTTNEDQQAPRESSDGIGTDKTALLEDVVDQELKNRNKPPTGPSSMILFYTWMIVTVMGLVVLVSSCRARFRGMKHIFFKSRPPTREEKMRLMNQEIA